MLEKFLFNHFLCRSAKRDKFIWTYFLNIYFSLTYCSFVRKVINKLPWRVVKKISSARCLWDACVCTFPAISYNGSNRLATWSHAGTLLRLRMWYISSWPCNFICKIHLYPLITIYQLKLHGWAQLIIWRLSQNGKSFINNSCGAV